MANYTTDQALIITSGAEITVTAALTSSAAGGLADWRGTISGSSEALRPLLNVTQARIRLDDGREGEVLIPDTAQALRGRIEIIGNGEAPF